MGRERGNVRWIVLSVSLIILDLSTCINSQDKDGGSTGAYSNPAAMEIAAQGIFSHLNSMSAIVGEQGMKELSFCMHNVTKELDSAFNFTGKLQFVTNCLAKTKGDLTLRLCTAAEIEFYFKGLIESTSRATNYLKPNKNCNLSSWVNGCEPGWACSAGSDQKVDLKDKKTIPLRTLKCMPCCEGFFCPHGLTCMIPCPLGSYCPLAKLNKSTGICEPYTYQLPPGEPDHTCGGADIWADVSSSGEVFCSAGSYCPSTVEMIPCPSGYYCRKGSIEKQLIITQDNLYNCQIVNRFSVALRYIDFNIIMKNELAECFRLATCEAKSSKQNITAYGVLLLVALSLMLVIMYNCSDQVLTTRVRRQARSREAAARSARETAQAHQKWKSARDIAKKSAVGLQSISRTFSRRKSQRQHDLKIGSKKVGTDAAITTGPLGLSASEEPSAAAKGKKKEPSNLTKMMRQLEENPDSNEGFNLEIGDKNLKTKPPKGKQLHSHTQIFRYAYGQIEKEKAMQEQNKDWTFSGVISMATDIEIRTRPQIELRKTCGLVQGAVCHTCFPMFFRLAADLSKPEKVLVVERVIESLGLQAVRDSLVGTVEKRGISGGQRKRVNVGLEMVMEPSLLILDEPTSGLDSSSSQLLLRALRREAAEGVNVCMVVHQPSYTLFKMFDDLILLAKGGLTVYHGSVKKVEEYFSGLGITVPERVNPPDHYIDILEGIIKPSASAGVSYKQLPIRWMIHNGYPVPLDMQKMAGLAPGEDSAHGGNASAAGSGQSFAGDLWEDVKHNVEMKKDNIQHNYLKSTDLSNRITPGPALQYKYYLGRVIKQRLREARIQAVDFLILLIAGICLGTLAKVTDESFGALALLSMIAALRSFSQDRLQYWRESASGMSSLAYFLAKDTVDHFNTLIKPLVYLSMFYFFNSPRSTFFENYYILACLVYCVTGIAYALISYLPPSQAQLWSVLLPVVMTLVATQKMQSNLMKYIADMCFTKWALEAFVIVNSAKYSGVWIITRCASLMANDYNIQDKALCLVILVSIGVVTRWLAFFLM
ncbi:ABC transporter-like, ATP-binding domain, partial [Dillenia turbinata]